MEGDTPRLAPLVVGPGPGHAVASEAASVSDPARPVWSLSSTEWTLAALLAVGTLVFLLRQHLRTPAPRRRERVLVVIEWAVDGLLGGL